MQRKAIIIGATGRIGQALVKELCSLYATVTVIARTPPKYMSENMYVYTLGDFDNLPNILGAVSLDKETDAFCCLQMPLNKEMGISLTKVYHDYPLAFATLCHDKGVRRLFLLAKSKESVHTSIYEASAKLQQKLSVMAWEQAVVFLVGRVSLPNEFSLRLLGKRAWRYLGQLISHESPLNPTQIGLSMALVAFWTLHNPDYVHSLSPALPPKKQVLGTLHYVSHTQMLRLTTPNPNLP